MTHIATAGVSSCAIISIGGFKNGQMEINEQYKADKSSWKIPDEGMSAEEFYKKVLYPTSQPLGRTYDAPFERIMEEIEGCSLSTKTVFAALNQGQWLAKDGYWAKELRRHGFKLFAKTGNSIGQTNYLYMRSPLAQDIFGGEE
jgi:hypothetical protein